MGTIYNYNNKPLREKAILSKTSPVQLQLKKRAKEIITYIIFYFKYNAHRPMTDSENSRYSLSEKLFHFASCQAAFDKNVQVYKTGKTYLL